MAEVRNLRLLTKVVTLTDHEATGDKAREIRKKHGITLDVLCQRMQVSLSFCSLLERGNRSWTEPMVDRFNKAVKEILDERSKVPDA
jgi:DNA-binding transcriptional regulator YiaG